MSPDFYMFALYAIWQFLLFPHCFLSFRELSAIFIKDEIVICKLFQFERVLNLLFGKGLSKYENTVMPAFGEHCGKRRKKNSGFFPFPTIFTTLSKKKCTT